MPESDSVCLKELRTCLPRRLKKKKVQGKMFLAEETAQKAQI